MTMCRRALAALVVSTLFGCVGAPPAPKSDTVSVATLGAQAGKPIKREMLRAEVMRVADRYAVTMAEEADRIRDAEGGERFGYFATGWKLGTRTAALQIAMGENAVENLLDMLVLTSLTRHSVESYWAPKFLGGSRGDGLIAASRAFEDQIWKASGRVLTPEQQESLRALIEEWIAQNPNQAYVWEVRFTGFSGQRAEELERVASTGGLLAEAQRALDTVDELRVLSERMTYYLLRAPNIARLQAELGVHNVLETAQVNRLMDDLHRTSGAVEQFGVLAKQLPAEREAAITQLLREFGREREAAIVQLAKEVTREREASIMQASGELGREREAAVRQVMLEQRQTVLALLKSQELAALVDRASVQSEDIIDAAFVRGALLILLWMVAYLVVRVVSRYWVGRVGERKARNFGSIELGRGGTQVPVGEAVARHAENGRTQSK
jgi:hypothetical protein